MGKSYCVTKYLRENGKGMRLENWEKGLDLPILPE